MANVCLILGAGASAKSGCPVLADFLEKARKLAVSLKDCPFKNDYLATKRLLEELDRGNAKSVINTTNIEEVFSAVEIAKVVGQLGEIQRERITEYRTSLLRLIAGTLDRSQQFRCARYMQPDQSPFFRVRAPYGYAELAEIFSEARGKHNVSVLTFNYDLGIDVALSEMKLPYSYHLDTEQGEGIPLLKLHGSLNWYSVHDSNATVQIRCFDAYGSFNSLVQSEIVASGLSQSDPSPRCVFSEEAFHIHCRENGIEGAIWPWLVPPSDSKSEMRSSMTQVWQRAATSLATAEVIVVIGYSLPSTDQFFKYLFALSMLDRTVVRKFLIVDPSAGNTQPGGLVSRFRAILGPNISRHGVFDFIDIAWPGDYAKRQLRELLSDPLL